MCYCNRACNDIPVRSVSFHEDAEADADVKALTYFGYMKYIMELLQLTMMKRLNLNKKSLNLYSFKICIFLTVLLIILNFPSVTAVANEMQNSDTARNKLVSVSPILNPIDSQLIKHKERLVGLKSDPYHHLTASDHPIIDIPFIHAFVASLSVIIVSELGDKTFFIAAIMAMRHPRMIVFLGAISALALMTFLSAFLGFATTVIPRRLTYYVSSALFAVFGLKMLREACNMSSDEGKEEYDEVQAELRKRDEDALASRDSETGVIISRGQPWIHKIFSRIFVESLTLTFLAEWGDRSQIATIILAAREDVLGVILGGTFGHALCTGLAVLGGRFIAQRISIRTVTLVGGIVFLLFAISAFFIDPA